MAAAAAAAAGAGPNPALPPNISLAQVLELADNPEFELGRSRQSIARQRRTYRDNNHYVNVPDVREQAEANGNGRSYDDTAYRQEFIDAFDFRNYVDQNRQRFINEFFNAKEEDPLEQDEQLVIIPMDLMVAQEIPRPGRLSVYLMCSRNSECFKITLEYKNERVLVHKMKPRLVTTITQSGRRETRARLRFSTGVKLGENKGRDISVAKLSMLTCDGLTTPPQCPTKYGGSQDQTVDHRDGDTLNNALSNFRWCTSIEQNLNSNRRRAEAIRVLQEDMDPALGAGAAVLFTSATALQHCEEEVVLDSCSFYTIVPRSRLRNIRRAKQPIKFVTRAGSGQLTHYGEFVPFPDGDTITGWVADESTSSVDSSVTILALNDVTKNHRVTYDSASNGGAFVVHTANGRQLFKKCLQSGFPRLHLDPRSFRKQTSSTLQRMWQGVHSMMPSMQRSKREQTSNLPRTLPHRRRRRQIEFIRDDGSRICGHMIESDEEVVFKLKRTENRCNAAPNEEDDSSERPTKFRRVAVDNHSYKSKSTAKYRSKLQDGSGEYKYE